MALKTKNSFELTLAIIKPHVLSNPIALKHIQKTIIQEKFFIVRSKRKKLTNFEAESFYSEHEKKFFYNRLVTFMTRQYLRMDLNNILTYLSFSGPLELYILGQKNAIQHWRSIMGPTKVFRAQYSNPETIRGMYGLSDTRNAVHGSDSREAVRKEIEFFFPEFTVDEFNANELESFARGSEYLSFDQENFVHQLKNDAKMRFLRKS